MNTLKYGDLFTHGSFELRIPSDTENMSMLEAALAWATNGFHVLPINSESKHAGSIVGKGWPEKSSRNLQQIERWFQPGATLGLAIHLGKSGAIAFDVDNPNVLPYKLREWITLEIVPFQSTRVDEPLRGHYVFASPKGRTFGNSKGMLKGAWGEVRGKNGIIVVSPTLHSKSSEGGQYNWKRTGVVPLLPYALQKLLPEERFQTVQAIEIAEAETFFATHTQNAYQQLLNSRLLDGKSWFLSGSRHDACRNLLLICMKDAIAGLYSAKVAVESIANLFVALKPQEEWSSPREFIDMTLWAIAQVQQIPDEEISLHRDFQLMIDSPKIQDWIKKNND